MAVVVVVVVEGMAVALVEWCNLFGGKLCNSDGPPMRF